MKCRYALLAIASSLALGSCAGARPAVSDARPQAEAPLAYTRLGETVYVDGPKVTPLAVLEDSRCPTNARCVWAGQVRLRARIDLGSGSQEHELTSNAPTPVADGTLELVEVYPEPIAINEESIENAPPAYRFGFRFRGGL